MSPFSCFRSAKDIRELGDSVVRILRRAGSSRNQPQFLPVTYGAQLADQIFNRVHLAAAEHQTYPSPVEMTDFVVLAICTGALGAHDFLSGPNQTRFHNKMTLVPNDLKLKEDIPDDLHRSADVRQNHIWPAGNVARSRVQIGGHEKQEDFLKKLRGFAEVVEVFYNSKWGAEVKMMAADFRVLAEIREEGHAVYPVELLACAFEKLMHQLILGVRKQTMECLLTMEATRKDTKRSHLFTICACWCCRGGRTGRWRSRCRRVLLTCGRSAALSSRFGAASIRRRLCR